MTNRDDLKCINEGGFFLSGTGYAPAHITTIFQILDSHPNPLNRGSRGLGICLDKGVSTEVEVEKCGKQTIDVFFNNIKIPGGTSNSTIKNLIGSDHKLSISVNSTSPLPMSQGFGLSGAGALSTAFALDSALELNMNPSELINAAHIAEINNHSGLGDVMAQATGGIVLRSHQGGFGIGKTQQLDLDVDVKANKVVVCTIGEGMKTSQIITDANYKEKINRAGNKCLEDFESKQTLENLFRQSNAFSSQSGLLTDQLEKIINEIHNSQTGKGAMVMLGNTIFAMGDEHKLFDILKLYGNPILCTIDEKTARKTIAHADL
jgi:pantoate kinase